MKLLSDISLSEADVNKQLKTSQTISKINTLMDVADGLKEWEGVQRIEIFLRIFFNSFKLFGFKLILFGIFDNNSDLTSKFIILLTSII